MLSKPSRRRGQHVMKLCAHCETPVRVPLSRADRTNFCSPACFKASRARVDRTCQICGKGFTAAPSVIALGKAKACSRACGLISQSRTFGSLADRYETKVVRQPGCWGWAGARDGYGYGILTIPGQRTKRLKAHRVAWEIVAGPIPEGIDVLHTCDVHPCTRNDDVGTYEVAGRLFPRRGHLFLGTQQDNMADRDMKGRSICHLRPELMTRRGSAQSQAKLTESDIPVIRQRAANGEGDTRISRDYGVAPSLISRIRKRQSWAHVQD
jgi:hypothetical protein